MIRFLWNLIIGCGHPRTFRERRDIGDVRQVMCFVCESCGHAWPVVSRSDREHREAKAAGTPLVPKAKRQATLTPFQARKSGTR